MPSWRYRRRAITLSLVLGTIGFISGVLAFRTDATVAAQLVTSSTILVTTVTSVYVGGAVLDDKWHFPSGDKVDDHAP